MRNLKLTITINFADGREINDIEAGCSDYSQLPAAIDAVLTLKDAHDHSSLVVVIVPDEAAF
jgi:hypothetical protein